MDPLQQLITDINTRYVQLCAQVYNGSTPAPITPVTFLFGARAAEEMKAAPKVAWIELGGVESATERVGGISGAIATDVITVRVLVWGTTIENARATYRNIRIAARKVARGPNLGEWRYELTTEQKFEWAKHGALIDARVTVKLPVPGEAVPTADVESQEHSVLVGGIQVC